jgi:serine/threonine-protein kinase
VDARSDTYSLGVALFEAATGRLPFDAEMKFKVIEAHISKPPPPPRSIRPSLSHAVEQVILRALSKNPASRFQTAAEFKRALENVPHASRTPVSDAGRAAAPRPVAARVRAGEPRRVKPAAVLVPLVMVALAAGVYFLLKGGILGKKVPSVVGMAREAAEQALRRQGLDVETDTKDDTAAAGTVVAQVPLPGEQASGGRLVRISVSTGMVAVPVLAGLTVDEARARLTELALRAVRIESAYSDGHATGIVVSSAAKPGSRLSPHSSVNLTVSAGRATCPQCGARREPGAKFCTKCGYKF